MSSRGSGGVENLEAEIVIIGGGGGGLAAAVAAVEKGISSVIVLEKRGATGGNTALAQGLFAADSPAQQRAMIDCRRDECFKIAMDWAHWTIDPRIVRAFVDKSGDTIRWLEGKGLEFDIVPLYPNQVPLVWHWPKGECAKMMKVLAGECRELGVQVLTRTPAKRILIGGKGDVTGVLAETEGEEFTITTRSVIIATGGYGGSKELLKKYCPSYQDNVHYGGLPHTGDGLVMATEIGAATEGLGVLLSVGPTFRGTAPRRDDAKGSGAVPGPLMVVSFQPNTVWVNKKGERFIDEVAGYNHFECSNAVNRQPDKISYTLIDHKMVHYMTENGVIMGVGRRGAEQRTRMPGLEKELRVQADQGRVKISDSWDEIASWAGTDPEVLKATVDEYNAACDQGYDPIFAKDRKFLLPLRTPPYYALVACMSFLDTLGGIRINEHMEVLDKQENPILGLYAAGVVAGGWEGETYCAVLSGAPSSFAINSGRIAGENTVEYVRSLGK